MGCGWRIGFSSLHLEAMYIISPLDKGESVSAQSLSFNKHIDERI